jgi:hypothetical protein
MAEGGSMKLYESVAAFRGDLEALNNIEELDAATYADTLEGMTGEVEAKLRAVIAYSLELDIEADGAANAAKRMKEIDDSAGLVAPERKRSAEAEYKAGRQSPAAPLTASTDGALDDRVLAANMLAQAQRMEVEAKGLIAEAARMKKEAERMHPGVVPKAEAPAESKPKGRTRKARVADAVQ